MHALTTEVDKAEGRNLCYTCLDKARLRIYIGGASNSTETDIATLHIINA